MRVLTVAAACSRIRSGIISRSSRRSRRSHARTTSPERAATGQSASARRAPAPSAFARAPACATTPGSKPLRRPVHSIPGSLARHQTHRLPLSRPLQTMRKVSSMRYQPVARGATATGRCSIGLRQCSWAVSRPAISPLAWTIGRDCRRRWLDHGVQLSPRSRHQHHSAAFRDRPPDDTRSLSHRRHVQQKPPPLAASVQTRPSTPTAQAENRTSTHTAAATCPQVTPRLVPHSCLPFARDATARRHGPSPMTAPRFRPPRSRTPPPGPTLAATSTVCGHGPVTTGHETSIVGERHLRPVPQLAREIIDACTHRWKPFCCLSRCSASFRVSLTLSVPVLSERNSTHCLRMGQIRPILEAWERASVPCVDTARAA